MQGLHGLLTNGGEGGGGRAGVVYRVVTDGSGEGLCKEEEDGAEGRVFLFNSPSLFFTAAAGPLGFTLFSGLMLRTSASATARMLLESTERPPRQRSWPVAIYTCKDVKLAFCQIGCRITFQ